MDVDKKLEKAVENVVASMFERRHKISVLEARCARYKEALEKIKKRPLYALTIAMEALKDD